MRSMEFFGSMTSEQEWLVIVFMVSFFDAMLVCNCVRPWVGQIESSCYVHKHTISATILTVTRFQMFDSTNVSRRMDLFCGLLALYIPPPVFILTRAMT